MKEHIKEALKEMFEDGTITLTLEQFDKWEDKKLKVGICIDNKQVFEVEETIGRSKWKDY